MANTENEPDEATLSEAIQQTEGLQPFRRVFHAANATIIVVAVAILGLEVGTAIRILLGFLGLGVVMDLVRLFDPKMNVLFFRAFSSLASPRDGSAGRSLGRASTRTRSVDGARRPGARMGPSSGSGKRSRTSKPAASQCVSVYFGAEARMSMAFGRSSSGRAAK